MGRFVEQDRRPTDFAVIHLAIHVCIGILRPLAESASGLHTVTILDAKHRQDLSAMKSICFSVSLFVVLPNLPAAGETTFHLQEAGVSEINEAFESGILNSEKLVQLYLDRIEAYDQQGPSLNSIITLHPNALEIARALDAERLATGPRSPLHGIPVLLKDNYDTFDLPTTAGSLSLEDSVPPDDAFLTRRLREAGAVILGKTNLEGYRSSWFL